MTEPAKEGATSRWLSANPPRAVAQPPSTTEIASVPSTALVSVGSTMSTTADNTKPAVLSSLRARPTGTPCGKRSATGPAATFFSDVRNNACDSDSIVLAIRWDEPSADLETL